MTHLVTLTWTPSTDTVAGYNVYRGTNPPGNEGSVAINTTGLVTGSTFADSNVVAGQKYDYVVSAVSASGLESVHSNEVTVSVPLQPPTNLVAVAS